MAKRESPIERAVVKAARAAGWVERKFEILPDDPDRMFWKDGRIVFMEFKAPGKPLRAGQARRRKEMKAAGLEVYLVDCVEFGKGLLQC